MPRTALPLALPDVAAFARQLGRSLDERHRDKLEPPGHVELLNLIARAAGHRNFQALKAAPPPALALPADDEPTATPALSDNARKALGHFDQRGRLMRWPVKRSVQRLCMWPLWTLFDAKRKYSEAEVNAVLKSANLFFDHVTLRRELINDQLLARESDCSLYWKLPARPDDETRSFLAAWRAKARSEA